MTNLKMTFDSSHDFIRACEHFEDNSKYQPSEIDNQNMQIFFECKNGAGAVVRQAQIEEEIFYKNFEYDTFFIV